MPIYTGNVFDGKKHKNKGLIRVLTLSRLSDNTGKKPDPKLWMPQQSDLYDVYIPVLAPNEKDVREWYQNSLPWEEFSNRYFKKIHDDYSLPFLIDLTRKAVEEDQHPDRKGVILQCVCKESHFCHRSLLASEIERRAKDIYNHDLILNNI